MQVQMIKYKRFPVFSLARHSTHEEKGPSKVFQLVEYQKYRAFKTRDTVSFHLLPLFQFNGYNFHKWVFRMYCYTLIYSILDIWPTLFYYFFIHFTLLIPYNINYLRYFIIFSCNNPLSLIYFPIIILIFVKSKV